MFPDFTAHDVSVPDADARRKRAAHMVGVSKVVRVQAAKPPAAAISAA